MEGQGERKAEGRRKGRGREGRTIPALFPSISSPGGTARIARGAGSMKRYGVRLSVRLSVCPSRSHSSKLAAAIYQGEKKLQQAGDIDRLLRTLSAYVSS